MDNINENLVNALQTIKQVCDDRKHNCNECPLANFNNECLVYEYPYLWNVKPKTIVKIMQDS